MLAKSPEVTLYIEGFDGFVTSSAAPIASGWSDPLPGRDLHPLEIADFHGALRKITLRGLARPESVGATWDDVAVDERRDTGQSVSWDRLPTGFEAVDELADVDGVPGQRSVSTRCGSNPYAGAAGWNFHTSAGFDLAGTRFRARLGESGTEECKVALCVGDARQTALDRQAAAGCVPGEAELSPVYSDNFEDAEDDVILKGRALQVGGAIWDTVFPAWPLKTLGGKVTTTQPGGTPVGDIPYDPPTDFDGVVSVEAELTLGDPSSSLGPSSSGSVSIGFSTSPVEPLFDAGIFWVELSGNLRVYGQGGTLLFSLDPFLPLYEASVKLEYDGAAGELHLYQKAKFLGWTPFVRS